MSVRFRYVDGRVFNFFHHARLAFLFLVSCFLFIGKPVVIQMKDLVAIQFSVNLLDKITNACNRKRTMLFVVFQKIRVSDD